MAKKGWQNTQKQIFCDRKLSAAILVSVLVGYELISVIIISDIINISIIGAHTENAPKFGVLYFYTIHKPSLDTSLCLLVFVRYACLTTLEIEL